MDDKTVNALDNLMEKEGVMGSALITRDGGVLIADLPSGIHSETFAIMCATIFGAAHTINSDLEIGSPESVSVNAQKGKFIIAKAGRKELLAVVVDDDSELSDFNDVIEEAIDLIKEGL